MKRVIRSYEQLVEAFKEQRTYLKDFGALNCWFEEHKPPRTAKQSRKVHAMFGDIADFTGDKNIKQFIKGLEFWPEVYVEHFGQGKFVPKSESDLSREEESVVIEHLYLIGSQLPGFIWNEKAA